MPCMRISETKRERESEQMMLIIGFKSKILKIKTETNDNMNGILLSYAPLQ